MKQPNAFDLIAAVFSPMSRDGSINCESVEAYAEYLLRHQIDSVFVNGSTGESLSLTLDERRALAKRWVEVGRGRLQVIVHVGHNALGDAVELARHAEEIGAAAISAIAPCFFRPKCLDDLISFLSQVAAAAPRTPFYFYHIPFYTHVDVDLDAFFCKASKRIPTLAGVKYSHQDLMACEQCQMKWGNQYRILFGCDDFLLSALVLGIQGAIGTTYNIFPATFNRIVKAYGENDLPTARHLTHIANQGILLLRKYEFLPCAKQFMATVGVDCGNVRLPIRPIPNDQLDELVEALRKLPLLEDL